MSFRRNVNNSRLSRLHQRKITLIIIVIIIASTIFAVMFFFVGENNKSKNTKSLAPDCNSLNEKIICPKNSVKMGSFLPLS
jgi:flagellar basal body-associated protein FliL